MIFLKKAVFSLSFLLVFGLGILAGVCFSLFNSKNTLLLENPIVLSENTVELSNGNTVFVNLELVKGSYLYVPNGGIGGGTSTNNWTGEYWIRVFTDSMLPENFLYYDKISVEDADMTFSESFKLKFDDYNCDLNPDFTLGQWSGSNYNIYRLFTITDLGKVENLIVEDNQPFPVSRKESSILLNKCGDCGFKEYLYHPSGEKEDKEYKWDSHQSKFLLIK